jgi:tRNA nucleotidyltransferase (CCA-adding enzyme)
MNIFLVGGAVRDEIMGHKPKDLDFAVEAESFEAMKQGILDRGGKIFQEKPEFFTIRANMPGVRGADFVLCRKDGSSTDGRRPDSVEIGTLIDDLSRRDLTMNAIAKDQFGNLIDPFDGVADIERNLIRCVGSAEERIFEDALRGLRALRFSVTKGFDIHEDIVDVLESMSFADALSSVSKERQREEMDKMFAFDTVSSMLLLTHFPMVVATVFSDGLRLSATMKES